MKADLNYLGHIVDCGRRVQQFTARETRESFVTNELLRLAVVHLIQTIGEAARLVSEGFRQQHSEVPWNQIVGMRNRIVHDYLNVDFDVVWQVAAVDVPMLVSQLSPMMADEDG